MLALSMVPLIILQLVRVSPAISVNTHKALLLVNKQKINEVHYKRIFTCNLKTDMVYFW